MNKRLKEIRKYLGYTQKKFAELLGVTQSAVSWTEIGGHTVSGQFIRALVTQFNVNEDWLKTGDGPMFLETETFSLDRYAKEKGASDEDLEIVKAYFSLEPGMRKALFEHFRAYFLRQSAKEEIESSQTELSATIAVRPARDDRRLTVEEKRKIVMSELPAEEKGQISSVSTGINGMAG